MYMIICIIYFSFFFNNILSHSFFRIFCVHLSQLVQISIPHSAIDSDYWRTTIDNKKGADMSRLKVARIFNLLHVLGYPISVADIDSLKIFRLTEHPLIRPHIEGMRSARGTESSGAPFGA
jgi:hypothetical protein